MTQHDSTPVVAGIVTAVVGSSSSFVVVLTGLAAVGASATEAASGLLALLVTQALGMLWLSVRHRRPITLAWSTPGAALLVSTGTVEGGWPAAVGAFVVTAALILLTGLVPSLGELISRIPVSLARAMLAGVLLPICLAPVTGLADSPYAVGPVVLAWLLMHPVSRRWAVPVSLLVALLVVVVEAGSSVGAADLVPTLAWTTPAWTVPAIVSIAVPVTGLGTLAGAAFGGHAINLAAITAALAAGPAAGADRSRRWIACVSAAVTYLVLALGSGALAALVAVGPGDVIQAAAGLALLGTLGAALSGALADEDGREAAVVCFLVAASGITLLGVGAAFWALLAGLVLRPVLSATRP